MKNHKNEKAINAGEQTPEVLSNNLKILGKDVIEFSVTDMVIAQEGFIEETGISFAPDDNQNAIGVIKPEAIDKEHVGRSYKKIDETVNLLSLLYGVGDWKPRMFRIRTSSALIMQHAHLTKVDTFLKSIYTKLDDREKEDYFRALDWYRQGISSKSLINKFLAFYNSIESFSDGYYQMHKSKIKKTKPEKENCIKEYFEDESIILISDIKRKHIQECHSKCLHTSAKGKMEFAFKIVFESDNNMIDKLSEKFFKQNDNDSFIKIRNDIAHGNLSEYNVADRELLERKISEIRRMARDFLIKVIS